MTGLAAPAVFVPLDHLFLARVCDAPCTRSYLAHPGPTERGWIRVPGPWWDGLTLCPDHAWIGTAHRPTGVNDLDGRPR